MQTDIEVGDVVVVIYDTEDNGVEDFEQYIGSIGEVVALWGADVDVLFGVIGYDNQNDVWTYYPEQLRVVGDIRDTEDDIHARS